MEEWKRTGMGGRKNYRVLKYFLHLRRLNYSIINNILEQVSDDTLMEDIRRGDVSSFDELFKRYWEPLYAAAYARLRDHEEAKDCVQDLFFTLWEKRERFAVKGNVSGYMFTALKNRIYNLYRSRQVREKYLLFRQEYGDETGMAADELLGYREFHAMIDRGIQSLPEKMREVFLLSRKEGLSTEEIASKLSLSAQTVKNQVSSALRRLRLKMDDYQK